jgi:hypothetical protein
MTVQDYTPIFKVMETLICNTFHPISNNTFNSEFELHLRDSREISA